ncbi:proline-rich protein 2-like [Erinaceus europaeus]|uniref:Proline-rich protein 2-like n=1 Tax=Erinaceus europaeus TaxID=9365 RepID=A0ABM3WLE4_ERIEU|nr:proline-rich protein 2-like [Erinaceus europaeus]
MAAGRADGGGGGGCGSAGCGGADVTQRGSLGRGGGDAGRGGRAAAARGRGRQVRAGRLGSQAAENAEVRGNREGFQEAAVPRQGGRWRPGAPDRRSLGTEAFDTQVHAHLPSTPAYGAVPAGPQNPKSKGAGQSAPAFPVVPAGPQDAQAQGAGGKVPQSFPGSRWARQPALRRRSQPGPSRGPLKPTSPQPPGSGHHLTPGPGPRRRCARPSSTPPPDGAAATRGQGSEGAAGSSRRMVGGPRPLPRAPAFMSAAAPRGLIRRVCAEEHLEAGAPPPPLLEPRTAPPPPPAPAARAQKPPNPLQAARERGRRRHPPFPVPPLLPTPGRRGVGTRRRTSALCAPPALGGPLTPTRGRTGTLAPRGLPLNPDTSSGDHP